MGDKLVMDKKLKVLPLGGLGEIGMNMMVIQYGGDAIVVDCGVMFSDDSLPGIDLIVPDFSVLFSDEINVLAVILTHGHEDHIGALPFLLRELDVPIYGSKFTLALVRHKLKEHQLLKHTTLNVVREREEIELDPFKIEFIEMSHSIADALGMAIRTPMGTIVHTGDFKIDPKPVDGRKTDLQRFKEIGDEGVFLLLSDSTNVEIAGSSVSESAVREGLEELIQTAPGWVVVTSFASHIPRLKQVFEIAHASNRKVLVAGRSMINNIGIAREHGFLSISDSIFAELKDIESLPRDRLLILSTGTQGEIRSALARMALEQHKDLKLEKGDRVILSSRFIPGNERSIYAIINHLYRRGAEVFTTKGADIHVSGHAYRDDLEKMLRAVRPKHFIPVHGEYRHLMKHIQLAEEVGVKSTFLLEDGDSVDFDGERARRNAPIELFRSVVDGRELIEMTSDMLRERRHMAATGMIVAIVIVDRHSGEFVRGPELFSRGLIHEEDEQEMLEEARDLLKRKLEKMTAEMKTDDLIVQDEIRVFLRRFFRNQLDRKPVVIPVVLEI